MDLKKERLAQEIVMYYFLELQAQHSEDKTEKAPKSKGSNHA